MQPDRRVIHSEYLEYALLSDKFQSKLWQKSSGSTVKGIRSKLLECITIPVPPLALQAQFTAFVARTDRLNSAIQHNLKRLELLKKSLLQQYFGEEKR